MSLQQDSTVTLASAKLYFEDGRWVLARRPHVVWLAFACTLLAIHITSYWHTGRLRFLVTAVPLTAGMALVPFVMRFGYRSLTQWGSQLERFVEWDREALRTWFADEVRRILDRRPIEWTGAGVMVVALIAYYFGGVFEGLQISEILLIGLSIALAGFTGGVGIYCALFLGRVVFRVGRFPVRVESHPFGIMSTGTMLRGCYVVAALIWFTISLSATWGMARRSIPLLVLAAPSLVVLAGLFVWCQVPMHHQMVEYKKRKLFEAESTLVGLLADASTANNERQQEIEFLENRIEKVLALPDWPFRWKAFVSVVASSLLSAGPPLVQFLLSAVIRRVGL